MQKIIFFFFFFAVAKGFKNKIYVDKILKTKTETQVKNKHF